MSNDEKVLIAVRARIADNFRADHMRYRRYHSWAKNELTIQKCYSLRSKMGFSGKVCIHPPQISHVNRAFSYLKQIEWVPQIMRLAQYPHGAFSHEGQNGG